MTSSDNDRPRTPRIAIIGAGFSGLGLGMLLRKAGIDSFTILEKADEVGGTWRDNTYPGCACDTPSFAYCFSFEQKTDWSRKWSPQTEILDYIHHCVRKYELMPHIRFGIEIAGARFDRDEGAWHLHTKDGQEIVAELLVSGVGQLSRPAIPTIPGLDDLEVESFHSACWNHDFDLAGKNVAVVGNAASAVQFVPAIAERVANLYVFQRSANWMLPKRDREMSDRAKRIFQLAPTIARLYRWWTWLRYEIRYPAFRPNSFVSRLVSRLAIRKMREQISDPELQEILVPDYPIGGKRILLSDDYYPALNRGNVQVIPGVIDHMTRNAIVGADGRGYPVDAVIFATGFHTTAFLAPMELHGLDGQTMSEAWKDGAEAYLGMAVAGFPNHFMTYGPNTNLGHNSVLFMIECQIRYIVQCIRTIQKLGLKYVDVRPEVMTAYNRGIQSNLAGSVWHMVENSWYKTDSGKITTNWPGSTVEYWWKTRRFNLGAYQQEPR